MHLRWLVVIFVGLFIFSAESPGDSSPPYWWYMELHISVQGEYRMTEEDLPLSGRYRYSFSWQGSMERDNGDYILYQGNSDRLSLQWHEALKNRSRDMSQLIKPEIHVNYVVRKGGSIHVDFNISPVSSGSKQSPMGMAIHFPQSAEHEIIDSSARYNRWIRQGSNSIALVEEQLYKQMETAGRFNWKWLRKRPSGEHNHSVQVDLRIFRKPKKSRGH
jgi:hypothetical protein